MERRGSVAAPPLHKNYGDEVFALFWCPNKDGYAHILHLRKSKTKKPEIACAPRTQFRAFWFWCKMWVWLYQTLHAV